MASCALCLIKFQNNNIFLVQLKTSKQKEHFCEIFIVRLQIEISFVCHIYDTYMCIFTRT